MDFEFLDKFEIKLHEELVRLCKSDNHLSGDMLLSNDDIDERWKELAPEYMVDAVEQIRNYPTVSVAWAAYLGLAVAWGWDADWDRYKSMSYKSFYGEQGFDDMDEHILQNILSIGLQSKEAEDLEAMIRRCAQTAVNIIRHEQVEPQSPTAFYIFTRAAKVMFRIGAAIELKRLGYKFEKVDLPTC